MIRQLVEDERPRLGIPFQQAPTCQEAAGCPVCHRRPSKCRIKSYATKSLDMRSTLQFSITLPNEMAETVRARVASGEYATESEVIREGLRALIARDQAVEAWLKTEVANAYDALKAAPGRAPPASKVRARLAAVHRQAVEKS